jgi:small subunit ribosomal protein S6
MRHYETLYLLNPDLPEDEYKAETAKFLEIIEKNKGEVIKTEEWGKRSLAYDIKKFDKGFYVLIDYCGEGGLISEIERSFKLDERVLKYQTLKLSDHADVEALKASVKPPDAEPEPGGSTEGEVSEEPEIEENTSTQEDREEG